VVPFLLFGNKAFLCTVDYHEFFLEKAVELAESHGRVANQTYRVSEFFGHQVIGW
jgi:hypothetical protein